MQVPLAPAQALIGDVGNAEAARVLEGEWESPQIQEITEAAQERAHLAGKLPGT